jgi:hypothetical protein
VVVNSDFDFANIFNKVVDTQEHKTFITSRNLTCSYYISPRDTWHANKSAILFLQGCPDEAYLWDGIVSNLKDVTNGFIIPGLLGYGVTSKHLDPTPYRLKSMAEDMIELLDNEKVSSTIPTGQLGLIARSQVLSSPP